MASTKPPAHVIEMTARVKEAAARIAKHRAAMAEVARQARAAQAMPEVDGDDGT